MMEPVSDCPFVDVLAAAQQACSRAVFPKLQGFTFFRSADRGMLNEVMQKLHQLSLEGQTAHCSEACMIAEEKRIVSST